MAHTYTTFTYNGGTDYDLSFSGGYRVRNEVTAVKVGSPEVPISFNWLSDTRVRISKSGLVNGDRIQFRRTVSKVNLPVNMLLPNNFTREAVVAAVNHTLHALQELIDGRVDSFTGEFVSRIESYIDTAESILDQVQVESNEVSANTDIITGLVPQITTLVSDSLAAIEAASNNVELWAEQVQQNADAASASAQRAEDLVGAAILTGTVAQFASYAQLITAINAEVVGPEVHTVSAIVRGRAIEWVRQVEGPCLGGGWSPATPTALPEHFGALGDGGDDTSGITAAVNSGLPLDGSNSTYRVTQTITLPVRRHTWRNIVIDGRSIPPIGNFTTTIVSLSGALPQSVGQLSSDVALRATSATLTSVTGVEAGDWVLLRSDKKLAETEVSGQTTRHSRACELIRVRSVAGNTVEFWSRTQDSYHVSNNARLEKVQTVAGVSFENVTFIGCDVGFDISEGFESVYNNVRCFDQTTMGVDEDRCYRTQGANWYFESHATEPTFTQAPYGLVYTGCHDCSYGDVKGLRTRHLTTTGSSGTGKGRTVSRGCSLGNIHAIDCFSTPVDQHPGGGYLQVGNVYATFTYNATQRAGCQFQGAGGHVASIEAPNGDGVLFDCHGFFQEGFNPHVSVGAINCGPSESGVNAFNYTNRYGTGMAQTIYFNIGSLVGRFGVGVRCAPYSGNIVGVISSGIIKSDTALGLGRCFYSTASGTFFSTFQNGPVECEGAVGTRIIQMDSGFISFNGGSLSGIGGNADVRLTNCKLKLLGTEETNLTFTGTTSQVLRAQLA